MRLYMLCVYKKIFLKKHYILPYLSTIVIDKSDSIDIQKLVSGIRNLTKNKVRHTNPPYPHCSYAANSSSLRIIETVNPGKHNPPTNPHLTREVGR